MEIKNAKYFLEFEGTNNIGISAVIDNEQMLIPLDPVNRHYAEILRKVKEEGLIIKDADE